MVFHFRSHDSNFDKAISAIAAKQNNCRSLVPERKFQNVAAGFAPYAVVETRRSIG